MVEERHDTESPDKQDDTIGMSRGAVPRGELERIEAAARGRLFGARSKPAKIGRFEILGRLGSGGMGVVYEARDPDLDRTLAVKVLRGPRVSSQARARVLREAQAIARIKHPNVIHVYETGSHDDEVYLAMEHVEGETLSRWLQRERRSLDDIIQVFRAAGRGLAAAHAAGVMHRDFKPDNVLVDTAGRPRVLDFGLARGAMPSDEEPSGSTIEASAEPSLLESPITATGTLMGTPAYMSPEQALGVTATPRADQFSFCVALWEAAYGRRPFASHEGVDLIDSLRSGAAPDSPPVDRGVPGRLDRVLRRGLSHDPEQRFETMEALLDALPQDSAMARRRHWQVSGVATLAVLGVGASVLLARDGDTAKCPNANEYLRGVWDAEKRASMESTFRGFEFSYVDTAWERTVETLDSYSDAWVIAYSATCDALVKSDERDPVLLEQGACLRWRLQQLTSTVEVLADADAELLGHTVEVLSTLGPIEDCEDPEKVRHLLRLPADAETARAAQEVRIALARADALDAARDFDEALAVSEQAVTDARALGDQPVLAEALVRLGRTKNHLFSEQGEPALREAIEIAAAAGHDHAAADAWLALAESLASAQSRLDEAVGVMTTAEFSLRQSTNDPVQRAQLFAFWAALETMRFDFEAAEAKFDASTKLLEEAGRADGPVYASVLAQWSGLAQHRLDHERARQLGQRALTILQDVHGPGHPGTVNAMMQLASANLQLGRLTEARALYENMLAIWSAIDDEDRHTAFTIDLIAIVDEREGKFDDALRRHERALEIRERVLTANHLELAVSHHNLGNLLLTQGKLKEARPYSERAIEIERAGVGDKHVLFANSTAGLARINQLEGHLDEARRGMEVSAEIYADVHGATSLPVVDSQVERARIDEAQGKLDSALAGFRKALELAGDEQRYEYRGAAEFGIARVLASREGGLAEAKQHAAKAAQHYENAGDEHAEARAEVQAWVADH